MAINFPSNPPDGKEFTDSSSGTWVYDKTSNSWSLKAAGNTSPFDYKGPWDFASATAPSPVVSGDMWNHDGTDGATIDAVYTGMSGTIAKGQMVLYDGSKYVKVGSTPGYPNTGDGNGATLDDRYLRLKGRTSQSVDGSATFAGDIQVRNGYDINLGTTINAGGINFRDDAGNGGLQCFKGGIDVAYQTINIQSDGSATFAGDVKIGGTSSDPNIELKGSDGNITAAGEIKVEGSYTPAGVWSGISRFGSLLIGTTSENIGDALASIDRSSGSATFAGLVEVRKENSAFQAQRADGTKYFEVKHNDYSLTLGTSDQISLKGSNGSVTAAGGNANISPSGVMYVSRDSAAQQIFGGGYGGDNTKYQVFANGTITAAEGDFELSAGGSITAAGKMLLGPGTELNNQIEGITLNPSGGSGVTVYGNGNSGQKCFNVWNGNGSVGSVASINGDGSITAAGDVSIGDKNTFRNKAAAIAALTEEQKELYKKAIKAWNARPELYAADDPSTLPADLPLREAIERVTTAGKINLNSDGSGTFAGQIKIEGPSTPSGFSTRISKYGSLLVGTTSDTLTDARCSIDSVNGNIVTDGVITAGNSKLFTDGSIIGLDLQAGGDAQGGKNDGVRIKDNTVFASGTAGNVLWQGFTTTGSASAPTSSITGGGSAVFAGTVTAPNVTFNLEPDDENNYEVSTETYTETEYIEVPVVNKPGTGTADIEDGVSTADLVNERETQTVSREVEKTREVKTYVGPTMQVKEQLLKLTAALTGLKTAAESASTCDELKAAINTALADI